MNDDPATLGGIVDIEPPVAPMLYVLESATTDIAFYVLLITGLLLTIAFIVWKHYFSVKGKVRRELIKLQKKFSAQKINHHDVACRLSRILREHLGLGQVLRRADFPDELAAHKERWETFVEQLSIACYSSSAQDKEQEPHNTSLLFDDAYFWLKAWPSRQYA